MRTKTSTTQKIKLCKQKYSLFKGIPYHLLYPVNAPLSCGGVSLFCKEIKPVYHAVTDCQAATLELGV